MVIVKSLDKEQLESESMNEYIDRICSIKSDLKLTWKEVADLLNTNLELSYSDSWYRRHYTNGNFKTVVAEVTTTSSCEYTDCDNCDKFEDCLDELESELAAREAYVAKKEKELAKKRVFVSDLVTQNNAYVRRLSREQTIKDIAHDYALVMNKEKMLDKPHTMNFKLLGEAEGILLLSDWHYGMVCDNHWNRFDPDICKARVNELRNKVINLIMKEEITHLHVLDLADLIAGRIHTQIRIESRFDVITQTMQVAELLAELLSDLSYHCGISFYSCLDNHSRLEPNKKESMDLESLARIIPWYLTERLKDNNCIEIHDNKYGADIITCKVLGHNIIGVHGDNDSPKTALDRLSLMTHEHYAMLCTAHLHHFAAEEEHQSLVISNGCLMGVDRYAEKLRLTSDPSQTLIVATQENVCQSIHRIVLH